MLEAGAVFAGYTVIRFVGSGRVGEVYLAQHPRLPRQDALKIFSASISADPDFRERFDRAADAASTLVHPNIVRVHEVGAVEGRPYFTMDFLDGGSLAARLAGGPLPAKVAARYVAQRAADAWQKPARTDIGVLIERLADRKPQPPQRDIVRDIRRTDGAEIDGVEVFQHFMAAGRHHDPVPSIIV